MNISPPSPSPKLRSRGGELSFRGGERNFARLARLFTIFSQIFGKLLSPLENFLDLPLSLPFSIASFQSLCKSLSISLISFPPSLYLSLSLSLYLQISPLENFLDPPLIILLFPKPKKDIERG